MLDLIKLSSKDVKWIPIFEWLILPSMAKLWTCTLLNW